MAAVDDEAFRGAAGALRGAARVVALTGAGVSTASGIPDFRSPGGIWTTFNPRDFYYDKFLEDPRAYWEKRGRLMEALDLDNVRPNAAHRALAALEGAGRLSALITQNIDGLHQAAGVPAHKVLEVHGSARQVKCVQCGVRHAYGKAKAQIDAGALPPACPHCGGVVKPGTVLFGEQLPQDVFHRAQARAREADLMLVVGSSLSVYPAADLPRVARSAGATVVIVNRDPTEQDHVAHHVLRGDAEKVLPALLDAAGIQTR